MKFFPVIFLFSFALNAAETVKIPLEFNLGACGVGDCEFAVEKAIELNLTDNQARWESTLEKLGRKYIARVLVYKKVDEYCAEAELQTPLYTNSLAKPVCSKDFTKLPQVTLRVPAEKVSGINLISWLHIGN